MRDNLDPGAEDTKCHLELSVLDHCGRMTTCIKEFSANFQILYFDVSIQEREKGSSEYLVEKTENTRQGAPENIPPN